MSEHSADYDALCQRQVTFKDGREYACGYPLPCWRHPEQTRPVVSADYDADREALAAVLREIGPKPGGVMESNRLAAKLLDHEWFQQMVARRGAELHPRVFTSTEGDPA